MSESQTAPWALPDLFDANPDVLIAAEPLFSDFGGRERFCGPIATIKCHEDNSLVAERVRQPGEGRVLVVDGGGSLRCALLGDNLAQAAVDSGWAGIVINGCARDVEILRTLPLGVRALAPHPQKSIKRGIGEADLPLRFAGVMFLPDAWLYADANGIGVAGVALDLD
ncbi:MAG: ribonuclease E activity regulator RraA [Pseudomonadota bacterium]